MFGGRKKTRHIVVTYASADRGAAFDLVRELEGEGLSVWVAPRDVDAAHGTAGQLLAAIRSADAVLLIVSHAANASKVLKTEAELAVGTAPILPVRIEDVAPVQALRALVPGRPVFDLFGERRPAERGRLVEALRDLHAPAPQRSRAPGPRIADPVAVASPAPPAAPPDVARQASLGHNAALRAFVGRNALAMLDRWREMERRRTARSPFLPGLVFGRYWLAYRKLWGTALASSAIALPLIAFALLMDRRGTLVGAALALVGLATLAVVTWLFGIALYRRRAERVTRRWNDPTTDPDMAVATLARRGGTHALAAALLVAAEALIVAALVIVLDPGIIASMTTRFATPMPDKLDLVDMTRPSEPNARYSFCLANPTDARISFTLTYADGAAQSHELAPHSEAFAFWSRDSAEPTIAFDHTLGDGSAYSERTYGLQTAQTDTQARCGGIVYDFTLDGNEIDLKRRADPAAPPGDAMPATDAAPQGDAAPKDDATPQGDAAPAFPAAG